VNGARKAAVFLRNLDKSLVARVLALLPRDQVEQATLAIAAVETTSPDELNSVLTEFKTRFQSSPVLQRAGDFPGQPERPSSNSEPLDPPSKTRSTGRVELPKVATFESVPPMSPVPSFVGPFDFLIGRHPDDVRRLLQEEQPQTIAVIVAQLSPEFSAAVLAGLAPDRQADVLQRVARLGPTDPEILSEIAAVLKERQGRVPVRAGGVNNAAAVLRESGRTAARSVLTSLDDRDAELADELRQTLFSFDDLLKLDDDTLRLILQETDDRQWALALKASPEPVRQKVLGCLSVQVARGLKAEMDSLGPVRLSEMTSVRQQIADNIRRLEDAGVISLALQESGV
jgi:flagellar motor switch protein FliG